MNGRALRSRVAVITGTSRGAGRQLALYLASSGSDFMTGQVLVLDGGRVMA